MRQNALVPGLPSLLAFVLLAGPASADLLADVRATLDRLPSTRAVRGEVEIIRTDTEQGRAKGTERKGRAAVEVGPSGVTLHFDALDVPHGRKEGAKKGDGPVLLDASTAIRLLDPADDLRRLLDGATFVSTPTAFRSRSTARRR